MKKGKLTKAIKKALIEFNDRKLKEDVCISPKSECNDYNYTHLDDNNKKKIRDLILGLSKKRDEFQIRINEWGITLNTEHVVPTHSSKKGTYFNIEIVKDVGFHIHCNDRRVMMKDENLYADILPKMKEIFDEINITNFNDIYSSIMIDNGLIRDANLNELLSSL